jgi:chloramphenicol O-acetyltransferase
MVGHYCTRAGEPTRTAENESSYLTTVVFRSCNTDYWQDYHKFKRLYSAQNRRHMNRNNKPSLTTASKRALLPRIIHYMFRL